LRVSSTSNGILAAKLAAAWQIIVRSVNPRTQAEAAIVADEIRLSRGTSDITDMVLPVAAALVAFTCNAWIPATTLIGWTLGVTLVCVLGWVAVRRLEHLRHEGVDGVRKWAQAHTALATLFFASWCLMGVFLWAPGVARNHMFLILVLASSLAASNTMTSAHPATALVAIVTHGSVMILRPLFAGDPLDLAVAGLCTVYCVLMASQAGVVYRTARRAREMQFEREKLIGELSDAKKESDRERALAAQAGRTRSEFLSNMNHELRTPMNAILGFSELIKSRAYGDNPGKYTEYATIIHDSGQYLLALINDMLDLARIEGGRLSLRECQFDLGHVISDVVAEHETGAGERGISLSMKIEKGLPHIYADDRAIRQIVNNLLSNAVKFTLTGGSVIVFAHRVADGRLAFGVEDTGIGIAEEAQDYVFERFGRGRHDVANAGSGTGLGLAIVKGFAEAHDGEVILQSEMGSGTRVTVYLPQSRLMSTAQRAAG
jgi:two-component system cell cycle sensor histidine kinase PleC